MVLGCQPASDHSQGSLNSAHPRASESVGLGQGLRIYIFDKFPDDAGATGPTL